MLEIIDLTKKYPTSSRPSVDKLTLKVNDGEIFGFIGPNGAGKSTTIKCMTGIIAPSEGNILIDGISLSDDPIAAKKHIGYVSDDHVMYEGLTGIEYVNFIADVFEVPAKERKERLEELVAMFELTEAIKRQIGTYSHGMKQKLNIIGALIHSPKLWVLDEPMTGLDPRSSYYLKKLMREHAAKGNIVFFSTHVLEIVEKLCDRIGIIDDGKLVAVCSMSELKARNVDKSLEELFLKLTDESAHEYDRNYDKAGRTSSEGAQADTDETSKANSDGAQNIADENSKNDNGCESKSSNCASGVADRESKGDTVNENVSANCAEGADEMTDDTGENK